MSGDKILIVKSIVKFLRGELAEGYHDEDCVESLEVAVQCIESAFNLSEHRDEDRDIPSLGEIIHESRRPVSPNTMKTADDHKNRGNTLMQEEKPQEALVQYSKAIALYDGNAVYYGNRAAAYSKLEKHNMAIEDCKRAIAIDPTYGKAYGRMGLALSNLKRHIEAREAFNRAIELEPDNKSYRNNLQITEEVLQQEQSSGASVFATPEMPAAGPPFAGMESMPFSQIWSNPNLVSLATQILGSPDMRDMMEGVITNTNLLDGNNSLSDFMNAGQQLAEQMQTTNPDLVDQIRRTIQGDQAENAPTEQPRDPPTGGSDQS